MSRAALGGSIHSVAAATFTFYLGNPFPRFLISLLNLRKSAKSANEELLSVSSVASAVKL
jgi:hypothetical protein